MRTEKTFAKNTPITALLPNHWDVVALCIVLGLLILLAWGSAQMTAPYKLGDPLPISLSISKLPYYALRTVLRLLIALVCSLFFTFTVGALAAKNKSAERLIIPLIDVLQSVPILGFLSIAIVGLTALFPNTLFGPECAAIFAIFTSQVWNMVLSFYQSLRLVPEELKEAAAMFQLSAWQRFWRIEVPFAAPGLTWNTMMSLSGSWFFVVASEAIAVSHQNINLPGIGSYIGLAISTANIHAIFYAIVTMLLVILCYDQLCFRPLSQWSQKFQAEADDGGHTTRSWAVLLFQRTRFLRHYSTLLEKLWDAFVNLPWMCRVSKPHQAPRRPSSVARSIHYAWNTLLTVGILITVLSLTRFIYAHVSWDETKHVLLLGIYTGIRVTVLILLSTLIWLPIGVWIGLRPRATRIIQPIIQFLAAFPANLFYPIVVIMIIRYHLNIELWTAPLMVLGTQWYILFNVIAGTTALPKDLYQAAQVFQARGFVWWRRLILPGIAPYLITGIITAAGGAWNASIIAESVSWGTRTLEATGLGAYITSSTTNGDFPRLALGIAVMCIYVLLINRLIWQPLYRAAEKRFGIET